MKKKYIILIICGLIIFFFHKNCIYYNLDLYCYDIIVYSDLPKIIQDSLERRVEEDCEVPIEIDDSTTIFQHYINYEPLCIDCSYSLKRNTFGPWITSKTLINNESGVEYKLKYNTPPPIMVYKNIYLFIPQDYNILTSEDMHMITYRKYSLNNCFFGLF